MEHSHRPGNLHQQNKGRKSRHASKRAAKKESGGRINAAAAGRAAVKLGGAASKQQRKHARRVAQQDKRAEVRRQRREQEAGAPKVVGFVALADGVSLDEAASVLLRDSSCSVVAGPMAPGAPVTVTAGAGRPARLTLAVAPRETHAVLDLCKAVDVLVLVHAAGEDLDEWAEQTLSAVRAQGSPTAVGLLQNVGGVAAKLRHGVRKDFLRFVRSNFPDRDEPKSFDADAESDRRLFVRHVCGLRPRQIQWRSQHPHMLVDGLAYRQEELSLRVSGYLRARHLSPDQLVHITGCGTYQLQRIDVHGAPLRAPGGAGAGGADAMESGEEDRELRAEPPQRTPLAMENEVDEMAGEQTWPSEEELAAADAARAQAAGGAEKRAQHAPRGTSDYQAAWYAGAEEQDWSEDEDADAASDMAVGSDGGAAAADGDDAMDEVDPEAVAAERARRREDADEHREFPDEVDTPMDTAARQRFARYRGVKSFRTSPWDPKESLPRTYAKIFELENFAAARQNALEAVSPCEGAQPGQYVSLVLENVSADAAATLQARHFRPGAIPCPLVACGLLPHENQLSVMHLAVNRCVEYEEPVRSKDPMVVHVGFRRFASRPIYSDNNANCDKAKLQRFMLPGFSVATLYAPISFAANCPALLFTPGDSAAALSLREAQSDRLVAIGGLHSVDPNRIVLKRTILSGFPYKIHKTRAVIRFMFFGSEVRLHSRAACSCWLSAALSAKVACQDIDYFKPIELHTKLGRTGHIRESVGTHGYMKCQFNQPLAGNDTVMMSLYKRQFPPEWEPGWYNA